MGSWESLRLILPLKRSSARRTPGLCALYSIASRGWFAVGYSAVRICMAATGECDGLAPGEQKDSFNEGNENA